MLSPLKIHHNGERWVSQDKNCSRPAILKPLRVNSIIRYYYTKLTWNPLLLVRRGVRALYAQCNRHLVSLFCWQRSLQHCRRVGWWQVVFYERLSLILTPQAAAAPLSEGAYGHGGRYGTYAFIDPKKDMIGIFLIHREGGSEERNAFVAMSMAATID